MKTRLLIALGLVVVLVFAYMRMPRKYAIPLTATPRTSAVTEHLTYPISGGVERITKKPFGIHVSPGDSPVSPERFTGYHTGVDFETTPAEQDSDVVVTAACDGLLLLKKWASGYGGVAVESCTLDGQEVTVVYGHLRLSSMIATLGAPLARGQKLGVLGTGYSQETDGERKHLHFAIHRGTAVDLLGYVQQQSSLSAWIDPATVLQ